MKKTLIIRYRIFAHKYICPIIGHRWRWHIAQEIIGCIRCGEWFYVRGKDDDKLGTIAEWQKYNHKALKSW